MAASLLPALTATAAVASEEPARLTARSASKAAAMKVDDPATVICVRVPVTGSRTQTREDCRSWVAWQAHQQEVAATRRGMNESR